MNNASGCYAVIFSSQRTAGDNGYEAMAEKMVELAAAMPGFLGADSARNEAGFGITVSYWESLAAIENWKNHTEHKQAQAKGQQHWYEHYQIRIAKVERAYGWPKP